MSSPVDGLTETVPTYRSLLVHYDPLRVDYETLGANLSALAQQPPTQREAARRWRIPVTYGGEYGIDVVYDPVGGPYAEPAVRSLAWQGRYLVVGFTAGEIPKIPLNLVLLKSCDIRGVFWGSWSKREPQAQHALLGDVARWAADGKLSAHIHAAFPLADIAAAMKLISDRKVMGKIVLRP